MEVPEPPDIDDLDDSTLRTVISRILERHDTLAVEVIDRFFSWGAGSYLPFWSTARYRVGESTMLAEWLQQFDAFHNEPWELCRHARRSAAAASYGCEETTACEP